MFHSCGYFSDNFTVGARLVAGHGWLVARATAWRINATQYRFNSHMASDKIELWDYFDHHGKLVTPGRLGPRPPSLNESFATTPYHDTASGAHSTGDGPLHRFRKQFL